MGVIGIVAEYNPFHTGHKHQIAATQARCKGDTAVVAAMSGNWVQSAQGAIADKWTRARLALMGGVDLVLELPTPWAISSAECFALGGVGVLEASGVVDQLSFGSECGQIDGLRAAADCLDSEDYRQELARQLGSGRSFAACRQKAVEEVLGFQQAQLLSTPNNNLGVEYLRAIKRLNGSITPMTVQREGADHNCVTQGCPSHLSATQIRGELMAEHWETIANYLLPGEREALEGTQRMTSMSHRMGERLVLSRLRTMTAEDWAVLPDSGVGEGLPQRLLAAGRQASSLEEFYSLAKTKRYAHARLRRLALWAYLGLTQTSRLEAIPYLRVLGFSPRGQELLAEMRKRARVPILVKPAHARRLDEAGYRLFEQEVRCTDLYDLLLDRLQPGGREWTMGPVRWGGEKP